MKPTKTLALMGLAGIVFSTSGCIVEPRPRSEVVVERPAPAPQTVYVEGDQYGDATATTEPPAPPPDATVVYGAAPGPDYEWVPGVYVWIGGGWRWHRGYWDHRPYAGAHWEHYHWERGEHGWERRGGGWR